MSPVSSLPPSPPCPRSALHRHQITTRTAATDRSTHHHDPPHKSYYSSRCPLWRRAGAEGGAAAGRAMPPCTPTKPSGAEPRRRRHFAPVPSDTHTSFYAQVLTRCVHASMLAVGVFVPGPKDSRHCFFRLSLHCPPPADMYSALPLLPRRLMPTSVPIDRLFTPLFLALVPSPHRQNIASPHRHCPIPPPPFPS